jgi:hypothetical protein
MLGEFSRHTKMLGGILLGIYSKHNCTAFIYTDILMNVHLVNAPGNLPDIQEEALNRPSSRSAMMLRNRQREAALVC